MDLPAAPRYDVENYLNSLSIKSTNARLHRELLLAASRASDQRLPSLNLKCVRKESG